MNKEFTVHALNDEGLNAVGHIAATFDLLLDQLNQICPDGGREIAIVRTKLEEACFFAKKAISCTPKYQKQQ